MKYTPYSKQDKYLAHQWFAWYPVKVGRTWVWLEKIWRVYKRTTPLLPPRYRHLDVIFTRYAWVYAFDEKTLCSGIEYV